jgi:hypothetical protein
MVTAKSKQDRFKAKLREQLRFLERSCADFDKGHEDEALRIATSLRVIFHHTKASVSLISHLNFTKKNMLSSSRGHGDWQDYLSTVITVDSSEPVKMKPLLGSKFKKLSIDDWWDNETVFSHAGQKYSRRKIILSAANKDGGAHVDEELEKYYEVLCAGEYSFGFRGDDLKFDGRAPFTQGITHFAKNAHLALIRQFAHEVLTSVRHFKWLAS